jgi:uncharacterized lipoprotein YajG
VLQSKTTIKVLGILTCFGLLLAIMAGCQGTGQSQVATPQATTAQQQTSNTTGDTNATVNAAATQAVGPKVMYFGASW